jgi:hypothetical protein
MVRSEPMAQADTGDVLNVVLSEFKALRDEINQRATYCHTLININIVATGTLAGFVLNDPSGIELLLLMPVLSPVLGLLWLDHSNAIRNMGDYIAARVQTTIAETIPGHPDLLGWEAFLDEHEVGHKTLRFLPLGVPILAVFTALPTFALVRSFGELTSVWRWVLWFLGLFLTVSFLGLWIFFLLKPFLRRRGPSRSDTAGRTT